CALHSFCNVRIFFLFFCLCIFFFFFFFSSRRRHTRSYGDWSSDVCSSDLALDPCLVYGFLQSLHVGEARVERVPVYIRQFYNARSEERRVGKEPSSTAARRWAIRRPRIWRRPRYTQST